MRTNDPAITRDNQMPEKYDPAETARLLAEFPKPDHASPHYFFDDLRDQLAACENERARLAKEKAELWEKYLDALPSADD